ncbi:MAG: BatD family protein [Bacteroidota bacterium]
MNFRKFSTGLSFLLLCSFNLIGQEIKVKIKEYTYEINEIIHVTYEIDRQIDSIGKLDLSQFKLITDPDQSYTQTYQGNTSKYLSSYNYRFIATKKGRLQLPNLKMYANGKELESEEVFIEITEASQPKEYKAGHPFYISLPDYMSKSAKRNVNSAIEYNCKKVSNLYGFVFIDTKEDLELNKKNYASINKYYDNYIKDFLEDEEGKKISKPKSLKKGKINFIETDVISYDKESNQNFYYLVGIAESKTAFYTIVSFLPSKYKDKYKPDFQKILYSLIE